MGKLILVTGGCRSGKSAFAEQVALETAKERLYIATCPRFEDDELSQRIKRHQQQREQQGWRTIEEELDLEQVLTDQRDFRVVLIDCLTLWINNMFHHIGLSNLNENDFSEKSCKLAQTAGNYPGTVIMVTNEVGLGIVPENEQARKYRDFLGRCNQVIAQKADSVYLLTCGIPLQIKPANSPFAA